MTDRKDSVTTVSMLQATRDGHDFWSAETQDTKAPEMVERRGGMKRDELIAAMLDQSQGYDRQLLSRLVGSLDLWVQVDRGDFIEGLQEELEPDDETGMICTYGCADLAFLHAADASLSQTEGAGG